MNKNATENTTNSKPKRNTQICMRIIRTIYACGIHYKYLDFRFVSFVFRKFAYLAFVFMAIFYGRSAMIVIVIETDPKWLNEFLSQSDNGFLHKLSNSQMQPHTQTHTMQMYDTIALHSKRKTRTKRTEKKQLNNKE